MSIKVGLGKLETALSDYGYAYLITSSADGRPHAVAVTPVVARLPAHPGAGAAYPRQRRRPAGGGALVYPPSEPVATP